MKLIAIALVVLAAMPFTAPFRTYDLAQTASAATIGGNDLMLAVAADELSMDGLCLHRKISHRPIRGIDVNTACHTNRAPASVRTSRESRVPAVGWQSPALVTVLRV